MKPRERAVVWWDLRRGQRRCRAIQGNGAGRSEGIRRSCESRGSWPSRTGQAVRRSGRFRGVWEEPQEPSEAALSMNCVPKLPGLALGPSRSRPVHRDALPGDHPNTVESTRSRPSMITTRMPHKKGQRFRKKWPDQSVLATGKACFSCDGIGVEPARCAASVREAVTRCPG